MVLHAVKNGSKKLIIGLGGSATTDGGTGLLSALGVRFTDKSGNEIKRGGKYLSEIERIDTSALTRELSGVEITVLCDVKNPLYGKNGAAYVYAPQKGASTKEVTILDEGLRRLADVSKKELGKDFSAYEGAGAAGGLGFAFVAFLKGKLKSGIDTVLDEADFLKKAEKSDLIITGEGKMDEQSFMGKVPFGVASRKGKTKAIAVVGIFEGDREKAKEKGICEIYETNPLHKPFEEIRGSAEEDLINTVKKIEI
jgi:glycerate kinase